MLGAGQQQVFNTRPNATGGTDITGIKPYVPFGAPMDAQGNVAPYGGQQTGMGWGAYGQQQSKQQTPLGGVGPQSGYGSMASVIERPQPDQNTINYLNQIAGMGGVSTGGNMAQRAAAPSNIDAIRGALGIPSTGQTGIQQPGYPRFSEDGSDYASVHRRAQQPGADTGFEYPQQQPNYNPFEPAPGVLAQPGSILQGEQQPYGYAPGTMQAGMGPGEQLAARSSVAGPSALQQQADRKSTRLNSSH